MRFKKIARYIELENLHIGEDELRQHLREQDQKEALSSDIKKSRNKPRACKDSRLSKNSN